MPLVPALEWTSKHKARYGLIYKKHAIAGETSCVVSALNPLLRRAAPGGQLELL